MVLFFPADLSVARGSSASPRRLWDGVIADNGDSSASFTGSLATTATRRSSVGSYAITEGRLAAAGNYTITTFNPGTLTVKPASIGYTLGNDMQAYGYAANLVAGLPGKIATGVNGETLKISYASTGDTATANAGAYAITGTLTNGSGLLSNYTVTLTNGTLTVNAASTTTSLSQLLIYPQGAFAVELITATVTSAGGAVNDGTMSFDVDGTVINVPVQSGRATAVTILPLPLATMPQQIGLTFTPANLNFVSSASVQSARLSLLNALNSGWVLPLEVLNQKSCCK
jgi:hypothetical protein